MKKVLVIGYVWPEPNSSAAGTHMMSLLNAFKAQNWQVEFATPAQRTEHMVNLDHFGITSQSIALNCESFDEYVKAYNPDIVMFDRFMMEEQFGWRVDKHCPNAIKISVENLVHLIFRRALQFMVKLYYNCLDK